MIQRNLLLLESAKNALASKLPLVDWIVSARRVKVAKPIHIRRKMILNNIPPTILMSLAESNLNTSSIVKFRSVLMMKRRRRSAL